MGVLAETLFQTVFDVGGAVVGLVEGNAAVHAYVRFYGNAVANLACTQVVRLAHIGTGVQYLFYLAHCIFGQRTFRKFAHAAAQQLHRHFHQHSTNND